MASGFWIIFGSLVLYGVIHSILAGHWFKNKVKALVGVNVYNRYYRLFFSIQAGLLFLPVLWLVVILPDRPLYQISTPWLYITIPIQILAVILMIQAVMLTGVMKFVGLAQTLDPNIANERLPLVQQGLYKYVRHPLYTCTIVILWLFPSVSMNGLALNLGITLYMICGAFFEEQKLLSEFGDSYANYRKKTAFIVPGIKFL